MEKFSLKQGLIVTVFLVGYFLIMELLGLGANIWLRLVNGLILFGGVFYAIRGWKKRKRSLKYFHGIAVGMMTSFTAALLFSIFVFTYLSFDTTLMQEIAAKDFFIVKFTPAKAAGIIFFEALFSGYFFSYTSLQFLKPGIDAEQKASVHNPDATTA